MKKIELNVACHACNATGLYVGMAEKSGAAVICYTCKGTGKEHFIYEYEDFTERKTKEGIERVFECNPGIFIGKNENLKIGAE